MRATQVWRWITLSATSLRSALVKPVARSIWLVTGVVVGGLIIGTISNGLNMLQIQTFYQLVVMGSLIIAAVSLDRLIGQAR